MSEPVAIVLREETARVILNGGRTGLGVKHAREIVSSAEGELPEGESFVTITLTQEDAGEWIAAIKSEQPVAHDLAHRLEREFTRALGGTPKIDYRWAGRQ